MTGDRRLFPFGVQQDNLYMKDAGRLGGEALRDRQEQRRDSQGAKHQAIVSP